MLTSDRSRLHSVQRRHALLATLSLIAFRAHAQQPNALPPVRQLGPRLAITKDSLGSVTGIRALSDGRVLVNDGAKRQLFLYDATLSQRSVVADSTPSTKKAYGRTGRVIAYTGDSSLFVDPAAISMLVIDPDGRIVRVMAPPVANDVGSLASEVGGAVFDAKGLLVYRETGARVGVGGGLGYAVFESEPPSAEQIAALPKFALHDSDVVVRGDLLQRTIDTAGFLAKPLMDFSLIMTAFTAVDAIRTYDDWAVLSDGSVAFVRGLDYHIDWINPNGTRSSTPRMAHDWHRLTDSERVAIVDHARLASDSAAAADSTRRAKADSAARAAGQVVPPPYKPPFGRRYLTLDEVPDYLPVFTQRAVKADADDHLWIRLGLTVPTAGEPPPIYDIVDRQGRVIDRVQLPPSLSIVGFGPGVVYLTVREGSGAVLAKYRIK